MIVLDDECSSPLCLDLTQAAESHAQVVGVLAGFAVAAIAVVLSRSAEENPSGTHAAQQHDGIRALFVALLALILAAFTYGTAAGVETSMQRAAAMTLAGGLMGAVAVSNLALGLVGLLATSAHKELTPTVGRSVALVVPLAGGIYVFVSIIDTLRVDNADEPSETWVEAIVTILSFLVLIIVITGLALSTRKDRRSTGRVNFPWTTTETTLAVASFGLIGIALTYFLVLLYVPGSGGALWVLPLVAVAWVLFAAVLVAAIVTTLRD